MIGKTSRLALSALALVCAAVFAACNCSPTLRYITIAPASGTVYVGVSGSSGVKAARHAATTPRRTVVSPRDITTAVCGTLQFAATGYFSNGTTNDQSRLVTWSSSNTSVATVSNTGLATGVALGFSNIGAHLANISATTAAQLEVDQLNTITVAAVPPVTNPLPAGKTQQFSATGNFTLAAGGSANQDISSQVTWATGNANVATTDQTGLVTAVGPGTTTVTATSCDSNVVGTASVTVGGAVPTTLVVTPATMTAATGTTVLFTAVEKLSDGTTQAPQSPVSWSSNATTVASINANTGLAQALTASTTAVTITATEPGNPAIAAGTASLTVNAAAARFAYVANISGGATSSGTITSYTVNPSSTSAPLTVLANTAASSPQQVLLHPSGDLLYYITSSGFLAWDFVNSQTGALTAPAGQVPIQASDVTGNTYLGTIDPTGRFIYVITSGTNKIYGFSIRHTQPAGGATDGTLAAIPGVSGYTDATLSAPSWVLTDNTGQFLYVVNSGNDKISEYAIQSNGSLQPLGTPTIATGAKPLIARTDINGHLYVANEGAAPGTAGTDKSVTSYTIGSNGALTTLSTRNITGALDTLSVIPSPNGNFIYVTDSGSGSAAGQVFAYGLTAGVLSNSPIGSQPPTGLAPFGGMAIDPTGVLLAVDNFADGTVSTYTIGSNGGLTATSTPNVPAGGSTGNTEYIVFYTAASGQ